MHWTSKYMIPTALNLPYINTKGIPLKEHGPGPPLLKFSGFGFLHQYKAPTTQGPIVQIPLKLRAHPRDPYIKENQLAYIKAQNTYSQYGPYGALWPLPLQGNPLDSKAARGLLEERPTLNLPLTNNELAAYLSWSP